MWYLWPDRSRQDNSTHSVNSLLRSHEGADPADGVDLRDYRLADLRSQFAIVLQEPVLFSTSITENIAYARPGATEEEIVQAAKMADAHDFILALPNGYQTLVANAGRAFLAENANASRWPERS